MIGRATRLVTRLPTTVQGAAAPPSAAAQTVAADLLLPAAVAERLGVSETMLARWRYTGVGPAYVQLTRKTLRYRAADVERYIASKVRASSAME